MHIAIKSALVSVGLAIALYLTGAFIAADWDISNWHKDGRFWVGILWLVFSAALAALMHEPA